MLKYFKCSRCDWKTAIPAYQERSSMVCGAVVQYLVADDPDVGQDGLFQCQGLKPIGCGGALVEITQEEAMSYE